jgi:glycosyltransferase involved in cell wall biosynthesis
LTARLEKILNGVNTRHFIPGQFDGKNIRKALRIPDDAPVIGTIAVFRFQKRLDVWIDLAQMILAKIPDAHFVLVGDGPLKSQLIRKVEELPLRDRIHFAGLQTEIRPYLAAFDVYMMTSVFEGLPVALLEAMASGCAVVSTNAGGIKEVIRHKIDGLLCEVDEPERIVELVIALIADKENRRELAYQARNRIVSMFSMENMVSKLEKLYKELIL